MFQISLTLETKAQVALLMEVLPKLLETAAEPVKKSRAAAPTQTAPAAAQTPEPAPAAPVTASPSEPAAPATPPQTTVTLESLRATLKAASDKGDNLRFQVQALVKRYAADGKLTSVASSDYAALAADAEALA